MADLTGSAGRIREPHAHHSDLRAQRVRSAWVFLAPALLVLALVASWPLIRTVYFSLTNASLTNLAGAEFIGFDNYLTWITLKSGRTIYWGLLADPSWCCFRERGDGSGAGRRSGAERAFSGPRPGTRGYPHFLGDPHHRLGEDVGLDAQRPVRHPQRPTACLLKSTSIQGQDMQQFKFLQRPLRVCAALWSQ
ncbi:Maltose/maltodextrin ABC transporter, permease protein MalF (plasmid) [Sinorhizobium sojae CCBAU 05684]|uniref:Maltose/maltodextrin ABC transporter, permease protein MalF n=1 Tax=Sinorhizobium sojae CCBAU 05684 TaxID=716928 RepID=A0A249PM13_9HYPH|nr:Maltose/maltodextrin ABC transporter, permease protein MalF [Sinorhizobium sojae CCBAU 05684]